LSIRILAVDPGYEKLGYAVIDRDANHLVAVDYGLIETPRDEPIHLRLKRIYDELMNIVDLLSPQELALERVYFFRNVSTAIGVGQSRGVALLIAAIRGMKVYEYTPYQVKQSVTGNGRATKSQVQEMVKRLYRLSEAPKSDDVADALAIGWCHGVFARTSEVLNR